MSSLLQDLRYALRALARTPVLSGAAVLTLGLGIGANTAMFGVVDRLFFRPPALVSDPDRIVGIEVTRTVPPFGTFTHSIAEYPKFVAIRSHARSFSQMAAWAGGGFSLGVGEGAQRVTGQLVTASFFPLTGVRPERGRFFTEDEDIPGRAAHVAVLSHEFWHRQFAEAPSAIGTSLQLGRGSYTVIGVAPAGFAGVSLEIPDVWVPMSAAGPETRWSGVLTCDNCWWLSGTIGRLAPGVSVPQAAAEVTALYRGYTPQRGGPEPGAATAVAALRTVHQTLAGSGPTTPLAIWLATVSGIVLLIACANVANLLLARAVQRRREIALRVALGSSRGRLIRQLYVESGLLALLGGGAAILLALWAAPLLRSAILDNATAADVIDLRVLGFTLVAVLVTTFLAGMAPALHAGTPDLSSALKSGAREGTFQRSFTRTGLLVGQVALTLVLLTGAGLFIATLRHVQGLRLGLDADRLIVASVNLEALGYKRPAINAMYQRMRERVAQVPGVTGASLSIGTPFQTSYGYSVSVPGIDSIPVVKTGGPYLSAITPDYFRTLGTAVREGRAFTDADRPGAQRVTIVNETMARLLWPHESALGKCLKMGDDKTCTEVVGVVEDARRNDVKEEVVVQFFIPLSQSDSVLPDGVSSLIVRTAGPAERLTPLVRREVQATDPSLPYPAIDPMPQLFADEMRPWRLGSSLFGLFGGLGLLLSAIGLYGVLSYMVSQRTSELGIRIALGAARRDLLVLVVGQGMRIALIGLALGLAGSLIAGKALASLLYGVSPHDPVVFGVVAGVLIIVVGFACYLPALKATRVDPMVALRYE
ncbi:MAG TPA: ABC transporter permease [Gemmatimonadales bacterium]|nr:ABC transporter permease [Gemmatimonadales bacterium]